MLEPQIADPNDQSTASGLKLVKGNFKISIDDFAAHTELIQVFKNENDCAVEVKYSFPLPENAQFKGFELYKGGKCYSAGLEPKENATDNYDDHIASGGTAFLGQMSELIPNAFDLSIGNFLPGSAAVVKLAWSTPHEFEKDQQTRQISLPAFNMRFSDSVTIQPISVKLSENIESISSAKNELAAKIDGNTATILVEQSETRVFRSLDLTIKTIKPEPSYIVEENTDTKEYPYAFRTSLCIPLTAAQRAEMKKEREFVFILDCSGSMNGEKIEQACRALKLFLASLPTKSKLNIVRFGDQFSFLWPESKPLNVDTLREAMKYSDTSIANMCGTVVLDPLKAVLEASALKGNNGEVVPRVVFLLTDGQFSDQDKILALVDAHVHQSSVHTIGIGQDVVEEDLKTIAQHGKGLALSVKTIQGNALQARIIELLQSIMFGAPSVKLDFGVPVKLAVFGETFGSVNTYTELMDVPLSPNRKYSFFGFMKEKPSRGLQFMNDSKVTTLEMPKVVTGTGLHTIACGAVISQLKSQDKSSTVIDAITALSLTFGVLSPYTAFVLTQVDNIGTPSYATMILEGLDLTVVQQPVPEVPEVVEVPMEEEKPKVRFTIEIPQYEFKSETQFNDDLYDKFNVQNRDEDYKPVPPAVLNALPNLRTKIEMSEPLTYKEQRDLGKLFQEHITNKRAIQRMLKLRRNEEEILLERNNQQEHADKIAEISGVMMKLSKDIEDLYGQFNAIISSYNGYDTSLALNHSEAVLKTHLIASKLILTPNNEDLINMANFDPKEFNSLKIEVDHKYSRALEMYKKEFPPTDQDLLELADQYGQYCRYILEDIDKACKIAKEAFDNSISELDTLSEDSYKDSTLRMQLLRDQLTEMTGGENDASGADQQPRRGVASHKSHLTANKADMDQILFMQHPDGNWNLNDVLKVIRINRKKLEEIIGDKFASFSESVWATVLVLAWLNDKFSEFISEFIMIAVKAEQYLEDNNALDLIQQFNLDKLLEA